MTDQANTQRRLLQLSAAAGLATIFVLAALAALQRAPGCEIAPLRAFQQIGSAAGFDALVAAAGPGCSDAVYGVYTLLNLVDLLALIPAYALFLTLFFLAMRSAWRAGAAKLGLSLSVAAALLDALETGLQIGITTGGPRSDLVFEIVRLCSLAKYAALAAGAMCAGIVFLGDRRARLRVMGAVALVSAVVALVATFAAPANFLYGPALTLGWLMILLHAIVAGFLRRKPQYN